ncbi:MAG: methyl-accepting chemotaxis protein, partial [Desulfamplus sp.]|nr:methyl-accepting chemotaxis protein [Desulfamplus sp.]
ASAQTIASAIDEIAQAAVQQASAAKANAELLIESEKSARNISEKSVTNTLIAKELQNILKSVDKDSATMIDNISNQAKLNMESFANIKNLDEEVVNLENIIFRLNGLNDLTLLLSVVGRVESVRAGEAGTGFADVSNDIRILVDLTSEKIPEIGKGIRAIKDIISTMASSVELSGNKIRQEIESSKETLSRLAKVETDMADILEDITEIQNSGRESLEATETLKSIIESISENAEHAATACQQAAAAAEQQTRSTRNLAQTADEIAAQADDI